MATTSAARSQIVVLCQRTGTCPNPPPFTRSINTGDRGGVCENTRDHDHECVDEPMQRLPAYTHILGFNRTNNPDDEYGLFNTHLLPRQLPEHARCVYVVLDPLNVMVRFYHHLSNQVVEDGGYTRTFEEFFEEFLDGTIVYGKWQDHIEPWLGQGKRTDNERKCLIWHYKDMKQDLVKETQRLAKFLLDDDGNNGQSSDEPNDHHLDEIVSRVVPHCTFDAMKRERKRYTPLTVSWKTNHQTSNPYDGFVRKGTVGDGRKFLLETQSSSSSSTSKDRWIDRDDLRGGRKSAWSKKSSIDIFNDMITIDWSMS